MYLIENPHLVVKYLVYLLSVWFFILMITGNSKDKLSAFILFLFTLVNLYIFKENQHVYGSTDYFDAYVYELELAISLNGLVALSLTMVMNLDRTAWKQALLLAFATFVHTMVLCDLTIASSWFSEFFFDHYDGFIILVGLLQIWVSYDGMVKGFNNAFRRIQSVLFRFIFHYYRIRKSLSTQKKIKGRT